MEPLHDRSTFESMYANQAPPWDIGRVQPNFAVVADRVEGKVLDSGCGTGENALYFAKLGHEVVGIDFLEGPIRQARQKAKERGVSVDFRVGDALKLTDSTDRFDSVLDSGLFHVFRDDDRKQYVDGLAHVVNPGGRVFLLCFSDAEPGTFGPRRVSSAELHTAFNDNWTMESIGPTHFDIRPDFKEVAFSEGGPKAWFAIIRRFTKT
jgi:2-polyprenyl-3-methyl-5-hydroxy-6-metoxy-1,4-benzoquinol methylase